MAKGIDIPIQNRNAGNIVSENQVICKGCGLCVSVCPKSVLALSTTKINPAGYNPAEMINEDCIACTSCAKMCPDCAIVVERLD